MEESKVAELGNKLLEFEYVNKEGEAFPFAMRASTIRHFAEHDDGTAIIADTMGGFIHVSMRYGALADQMAEYDRFVELRMGTLAEGGVTIERTQRCSVRAQNIVWYGAHVEGGTAIVDCFGRTIRVANAYDEMKRLLEGM
jgi:hypothetical protein